MHPRYISYGTIDKETNADNIDFDIDINFNNPHVKTPKFHKNLKF